jgi:glutathione S-transferase
MKELVLYDGGGTPSPRRVRLCLIEKGLPFKIKWLNLALMDQKAPSYLKLNPMGLVPTLVHDGKTIFESNVINEYIEAQFPNPPLVPSNAYGLAQMRMWFAFESDFGKPFRDAAYETFAKDRLKNLGITEDELREEIGKRTANQAYVRFATRCRRKIPAAMQKRLMRNPATNGHRDSPYEGHPRRGAPQMATACRSRRRKWRRSTATSPIVARD